MVPNEDSYCEIDPRVVDKWGIPVLRFHFKWSDYEIKQAKHMQETFRAIIHEMGGTPIVADADARANDYGLAPGGRIIHELGVTRMGNDPNTSVLNKNCQAHDAKNVFVADGGPFVVAGRTRTARGRSSRWRCAPAHFIADERKKGSDLSSDRDPRLARSPDIDAATDC